MLIIAQWRKISVTSMRAWFFGAGALRVRRVTPGNGIWSRLEPLAAPWPLSAPAEAAASTAKHADSAAPKASAAAPRLARKADAAALVSRRLRPH